MSEPDAWQKWFEGIWALREERIYRDFFGDLGPGIYPIPSRTFESIGFKDADPRFLTHGVFECPPNGARKEWIYVSSGMSNAWGDSPETADPNGYSGLGFEFTLHSRQRAAWPIEILHWIMAVQLMVACGRIKGELLMPHDRVPLGGSIGKKDGTITHLLVLTPDDAGPRDNPSAPTYPAQFQLPTGKVDLLLLLGISTREADFARTQGAQALLPLLASHDFLPFTSPSRLSAI